MKMCNAYHTHSLSRKIKRDISRKRNKCLIAKNADKTILVILHLFYEDSWKEIREYLLNLNNYNWTLYVTIPSIKKDVINEDDIKSITKEVYIVYYDNIGYDIYPFFDLVKKLNLNEYDVVIKLQSKGVHRKWIYIYNQLFFNREWFLNLYEGVIGATIVHKTLDRIINDPKVGLVAADNLIVQDPPYKQEITKKGLQKYGIRIEMGYWFVAGTCFAIKPCCLDWIKDFPVQIEDFHKIPNSRGFDLAHLLERYLCITVQELGYDYYSNNVLNYSRGGVRKIIEKQLSNYSSLRLYDLPYRYDPEFFFWIYDNKFIKYRVKTIKLQDLKYEFVFGDEPTKLLPLEEMYPYRYLKGDKQAYLEYCNYHKKYGLPVMSEERFNNLCQSIDKQGFDSRYIIIVSRDNIVLDGQHRACYLASLCGLDFEVDVLEIVIINRNYLRQRLSRLLMKK